MSSRIIAPDTSLSIFRGGPFEVGFLVHFDFVLAILADLGCPKIVDFVCEKWSDLESKNRGFWV